MPIDKAVVESHNEMKTQVRKLVNPAQTSIKQILDQLRADKIKMVEDQKAHTSLIKTVFEQVRHTVDLMEEQAY